MVCSTFPIRILDFSVPYIVSKNVGILGDSKQMMGACQWGMLFNWIAFALLVLPFWMFVFSIYASIKRIPQN